MPAPDPIDQLVNEARHALRTTFEEHLSRPLVAIFGDCADALEALKWERDAAMDMANRMNAIAIEQSTEASAYAKERDQLRAALEFYSHREHYPLPIEPLDHFKAVKDMGAQARAALAHTEKP